MCVCSIAWMEVLEVTDFQIFPRDRKCVFVLSSIDGSIGSDRLTNIDTDSEVCVLSSIDGSLGSDRLPNISTDSEVCVCSLSSIKVFEETDFPLFPRVQICVCALSSIDICLGSDILPNHFTTSDVCALPIIT